ncbi:MAG: hypothetical protein EHM72_12580 [Calditrichaeota bacterium]|nr:MAG: hypothetical protein EHM72_12580 [Calditrichota bacterium]
MLRFGLLIILLYGLSCSGSIWFITDNSYWREHSIRSRPVNVLTNRNEVNFLQVEGLYHPMVTAIKMPALFYVNEVKQLAYLPLSAELDCEYGDWIKATGRTDSRPISSAYGQQVETRIFKVESFKLIQSSHDFLPKIQADYHRQRRKIERAVRQDGSKLLLPDKPDWLMVLDAANQRIVATLSVADLLYAGQVDFVYDFDQNLSAIYADHWFKGE